MPKTPSPSLARKLTTFDAIVIGLGSMIGAGVFAAFGPAALAAGSGLLVGLVIAAFIAYCNAVASAQLAMQYPTSGGTYIYGRERLGHWWGYIAGWGFVIGKTASVAAMALTVASYAAPDDRWLQRLIAVLAVCVLTALNYRGVTKTAAAARVLLALTLLVLASIIVGILVFGDLERSNLDNVFDFNDNGLYGLLQSAGILFFAFAGYARIATLGEEVRDPETTIPKAIPLALFTTIGIYALVGVSALLAAGPDRLAASTAPILTAVEQAAIGDLGAAVRFGGVVASLGAMLALIAGIGRTTLAMARNSDLPSWLATVHPVHRVPHHAEIAVALVVSAVVLVVDVRGAIGFSSFGVLTYYAIANASAFTQTGNHRHWPRTLNVVGLAGCVILAVALPWQSVVMGLIILAIGLAGRAVAIRTRR